MTRIYDFDGILNFRDFGNYSANEGRVVKPGKLFRSAHFNQASDTDLERLAALGIELVVDLRHKPERLRQPSRWPALPMEDYMMTMEAVDIDSFLEPAALNMAQRYGMRCARYFMWSRVISTGLWRQ